MRPGAIGAPIHFVLLNSNRRAHLQELPAVLSLSQPGVFFRVVRPALEDFSDIGRFVHKLYLRKSMSLSRQGFNKSDDGKRD